MNIGDNVRLGVDKVVGGGVWRGVGSEVHMSNIEFVVMLMTVKVEVLSDVFMMGLVEALVMN